MIMSIGCGLTSYLRQIIHTFCNKITSNSVITQNLEQEQESLVDDNS
jgi:hypothetical protein